MASLEIEGFEEFEKFLSEDMVLDEATKKKSVRAGITKIGKSIEKYSPEGKTKKLKVVKIKVKNTGLAIEGSAASGAFYDVFQNFGTSEQKANVGYFDRAFDDASGEAMEAAAEIIFKKMR